MKKLLKLKELKKLFLFLPLLLSISCAVNVKTVNDSFYGTQHYQTDYMTIIGWLYEIKFRFVASKNPNVILVEVQYIAYDSFTVSQSDNIVLKFSDNSFVNLIYINSMPAVDRSFYTSSGNVYSSSSYTINAAARINSDIGTLTAIRIENSGGFKNLDVKKSFASKFKKAYEDIKKKINE